MPLRGLARWDYCHVDACGGHADGWGVRACAAALTVGKDLCILSIPGKNEEKSWFDFFGNFFLPRDKSRKKILFLKKLSL